MFCFSHVIIAPLLRVCSVFTLQRWGDGSSLTFLPQLRVVGRHTGTCTLLHRGHHHHLTITTPVPAALHHQHHHCCCSTGSRYTAALQHCLGIDHKSQDGHQMAAL